ncbi:MAG: glycosyltransferase [Undibacterium sp.]|nr:glycosyltransferase [Opitutaceae bacterium]
MPTPVKLSVVLPTHNPHPGRLHATLLGLSRQTLPVNAWELLVVDNASQPALTDLSPFPFTDQVHIVREPTLGLAHARRAGFRAARGDIVILVDDDNVLAPDYLSHVVRLFAAHPELGVIGGPSRPDFEQPPAEWQHEFFGLLALRDLGPAPLIESLRSHPGHGAWDYPACAPIGAGMALRRTALTAWLDVVPSACLTDRRGTELTSGGDNDIVLALARAGWAVGYFPELALIHIIPAGRLSPDYLARLNRGIQKSWMQVLTRHSANPWKPIPAWSVPLRELKAWFTCRAWASSAARIRWEGRRGHFAGRVSTPR